MYQKLNFSVEVINAITKAQNHYCANCLNKIHSFHHKLSNTKANQKKYPLFLQSPFNCVGLCEKCHRDFSHLFKITEKLAEYYESWLVVFGESYTSSSSSKSYNTSEG